MASGPWREPCWTKCWGFRPNFIQHHLAHAVRDPNGRAYNRTAYLPERCQMMQKRSSCEAPQSRPMGPLATNMPRMAGQAVTKAAATNPVPCRQEIMARLGAVA